MPDCDGWLALLAECGVDINGAEFRRVHGDDENAQTPAPKIETFQGCPLISRSSYDFIRPEVYGTTEYWIFEEESDAHPICINPRTAYLDHDIRPRHRYDRMYRFRWTIYNLIGAQPLPRDFPSHLLPQITTYLGPTRLNSSKVYCLIREWLRRRKLQRFYTCIPIIIQLIGGPRWDLTNFALPALEHDFRKLHHTFNRINTDLNRRRFPKLLFVALALLDMYRIHPPYELPGCITDLYDIRLSRLFNRLDSHAEAAQLN